MFIDIIIVVLFSILAFYLSMYGEFASNFSLNNQDDIKGQVMIYGGKDYNLKSHSMGGGLINDWEKVESMNDINFLESSKKTNFLSLDIEKFQGTFTLNLSAPCKITGVVYKNTQSSYDTEFVEAANKFSSNDPDDVVFGLDYNKSNSNNGNSIDTNPWYNVFGEHNVYYIHIPKDKATKNITFSSVGEVENIGLLLLFEPVNDTNIVQNFKTGEKYYNGIRYILKKGQMKDKLNLRNFIVTEGRRSYGISNASNKITLQYSSPLVFYVNEFVDN